MRHIVCELTREGGAVAAGAEVDDGAPAAAVPHAPRRVLRAEEGAFEIRRQDVVPLALLQVQQPLEGLLPGVVHL